LSGALPIPINHIHKHSTSHKEDALMCELKYIAAGILLALFMCEKFGTYKLGSVFGGVMFVWFCFLGVFGLLQVVKNLKILKAVSPHYGFNCILMIYYVHFSKSC
jgi:K+ transporter